MGINKTMSKRIEGLKASNPTRKLILSAFSFLAFNTMSPASSHADGISGDVVRIGVLTDMSGPYADLGGRGSVLAAQLAVRDFGGRVRGKPIDLIYADHQNRPDIGSTKIREWFDRDGVDMVTDVLGSPVGIAVAKVAADKKRIVMNTGTVSARLTNEDCNSYTVHYVYDSVMFANGTASAMVRQGQKNWFFITVDNVFGQSLEKDSTDVVLANGGIVAGSVRHPLNTSDFSSFLLRAQASGAQVVALANTGADTINAIKTAREFGITQGQKVASLLAFISDVHALTPEVAQNMILTDAWYWDLNEETRAFAKRFFAEIKQMPNMAHAGVYSAVTTYLKAVEAAGTDDPDAVMARMKEARINDLFAKDGYIREDGRMVHDVYVMQVKKPSEVAYPWDYLRLIATVKGEDAFAPLSKSRCPLVKNRS